MTAVDLLLGWINRATAPGGAAIRERYRFASNSWGDGAIRPDCNTEAVYAYALAGQLDHSRAIWDDYKGMQNTNGSWPFCHLGNDPWWDATWTNDNAEIAIFLIRAASVDSTNAAAYLAAADATLAWLLSIRDNASGMWRAANLLSYRAPWSTAHAVTALATAYPTAGAQQASYLAAIEAGLSAITARIGMDGRVQTACEVHGVQEAWRPPSSDQSIAIRAYATAEKNCPASTQRASWEAARHRLHTWMDPLLDPSGAVRNGYGVGATHADVAHITDHVYTTAFAIEAYRLSALVDSNPVYLAAADAIASFAVGNIWRNPSNPDEDGCIRGAYDLDAQDFGTTEVAQNLGEEGGGGVAYTGWTAAPIAALLLERLPGASPGTRRRGGAVAFM